MTSQIYFLRGLYRAIVVVVTFYAPFPSYLFNYSANFRKCKGIKLIIQIRNFCGKKISGPESGFLSGFRFLYFWLSNLKNFDAGVFVLTSTLIHKIFRFSRDPVSCPVSGFWTSDSQIEKSSMQLNLYWHKDSSTKFSGSSRIRFFVRFPDFAFLMVKSKNY